MPALVAGASYAASVRDRTGEFQAMLSHMPATAPAAAPKRATSSHAQFSQRAQGVAKDLSATMAKLQRLSQLVRRKTLFDDRPVEISELTYIVKHDIAGLNRQLAELQQLAATRGGRASRADEHCSNVVTMLQSSLANTTTSFQDILEVRTQNMKASKDRSDQLYHGATLPTVDTQRTHSPLYQLARAAPAAAPGAAPGAAPAAAPSAAPPPASALQKRVTSTYSSHDEEKSSDQGYLALDMMEAGHMSQQQLLLQEDQQAGYIQERSSAIESIESTISELGQIFGQLAHMVAQQGETVQRIDDDVLQVSDNVEGARRELLKYYARIANNRWLMLKIFGVLIVFFLRTSHDSPSVHPHFVKPRPDGHRYPARPSRSTPISPRAAKNADPSFLS